MKIAQETIDRTAITLSFICTVHCLLLPLAIVLLPTLAATSFGDEQFHRLMLVAVIPTSAIALFMGCRKHKRWNLIFIGFLGLSVLTISALFGHALLGDSGEKAGTLMGAAIIAFGHIRNQRLCASRQCHC